MNNTTLPLSVFNLSTQDINNFIYTNKESMQDYLINHNNNASLIIVSNTFLLVLVAFFLMGFIHKVSYKYRFIIKIYCIIVFHIVMYAQILLYYLMTDKLYYIIPMVTQFFAVIFFAKEMLDNKETLKEIWEKLWKII